MLNLKYFKPFTPSVRRLKLINYKNIFLNKKFLKSNSKKIKRKYGHNNQGRLTSYHKGGGHKRIYRFLNNKPYTFGVVEGLEYDPYRTAFLMRLYLPESNTFCYQIAPLGIKRGYIVRFLLEKKKYKFFRINYFIKKFNIRHNYT